MADMGNVEKNRLKERWLEIYKALTQLEDLHVWPADKDITKLEDELFRELDTIEHQLSQDYSDQA